MEQINQQQPPPNPAKVTDSRSPNYVAEHGNESWELDALEPAYLVRLIKTEVGYYRDDDLWDKAMKKEKAERDILSEAAEGVKKRLKKGRRK
jgi:hypothetical protein